MAAPRPLPSTTENNSSSSTNLPLTPSARSQSQVPSSSLSNPIVVTNTQHRCHPHHLSPSPFPASQVQRSKRPRQGPPTRYTTLATGPAASSSVLSGFDPTSVQPQSCPSLDSSSPSPSHSYFQEHRPNQSISRKRFRAQRGSQPSTSTRPSTASVGRPSTSHSSNTSSTLSGLGSTVPSGLPEKYATPNGPSSLRHTKTAFSTFPVVPTATPTTRARTHSTHQAHRRKRRHSGPIALSSPSSHGSNHALLPSSRHKKQKHRDDSLVSEMTTRDVEEGSSSSSSTVPVTTTDHHPQFPTLLTQDVADRPTTVAGRDQSSNSNSLSITSTTQESRPAAAVSSAFSALEGLLAAAFGSSAVKKAGMMSKKPNKKETSSSSTNSTHRQKDTSRTGSKDASRKSLHHMFEDGGEDGEGVEDEDGIEGGSSDEGSMDSGGPPRDEGAELSGGRMKKGRKELIDSNSGFAVSAGATAAVSVPGSSVSSTTQEQQRAGSRQRLAALSSLFSSVVNSEEDSFQLRFGVGSRWNAKVAGLESANPEKQSATLMELNEWLSYANEDCLGGFPIDRVVNGLIDILAGRRRCPTAEQQRKAEQQPIRKGMQKGQDRGTGAEWVNLITKRELDAAPLRRRRKEGSERKKKKKKRNEEAEIRQSQAAVPETRSRRSGQEQFPDDEDEGDVTGTRHPVDPHGTPAAAGTGSQDVPEAVEAFRQLLEQHVEEEDEFKEFHDEQAEEGKTDDGDEDNEDVDLSSLGLMGGGHPSSSSSCMAFEDPLELVTRKVTATSCLRMILDVAPQSVRTVASGDGIQVLCQQLQQIEYIDLAEAIVVVLQQLASETPTRLLEQRGLSAMLEFVEFFPIAVQRGVVKASCVLLNHIQSKQDYQTSVQSSIPQIGQFLLREDEPILQNVCQSFHRLVNFIAHENLVSPGFAKESIDEMISQGIMFNIVALMKRSIPDRSSTHGSNGDPPLLNGYFFSLEALYILSVFTFYSNRAAELLVELGVLDVITELFGSEATPGQDSLLMLRALGLMTSLLPVVVFEFCPEETFVRLRDSFTGIVESRESEILFAKSHSVIQVHKERANIFVSRQNELLMLCKRFNFVLLQAVKLPTSAETLRLVLTYFLSLTTLLRYLASVTGREVLESFLSTLDVSSLASFLYVVLASASTSQELEACGNECSTKAPMATAAALTCIDHRTSLTTTLASLFIVSAVIEFQPRRYTSVWQRYGILDIVKQISRIEPLTQSCSGRKSSTPPKALDLQLDLFLKSEGAHWNRMVTLLPFPRGHVERDEHSTAASEATVEAEVSLQQPMVVNMTLITQWVASRLGCLIVSGLRERQVAEDSVLTAVSSNAPSAICVREILLPSVVEQLTAAGDLSTENTEKAESAARQALRLLRKLLLLSVTASEGVDNISAFEVHDSGLIHSVCVYLFRCCVQSPTVKRKYSGGASSSSITLPDLLRDMRNGTYTTPNPPTFLEGGIDRGTELCLSITDRPHPLERRLLILIQELCGIQQPISEDSTAGLIELSHAFKSTGCFNRPADVRALLLLLRLCVSYMGQLERLPLRLHTLITGASDHHHIHNRRFSPLNGSPLSTTPSSTTQHPTLSGGGCVPRHLSVDSHLHQSVISIAQQQFFGSQSSASLGSQQLLKTVEVTRQQQNQQQNQQQDQQQNQQQDQQQNQQQNHRQGIESATGLSTADGQEEGNSSFSLVPPSSQVVAMVHGTHRHVQKYTMFKPQALFNHLSRVVKIYALCEFGPIVRCRVVFPSSPTGIEGKEQVLGRKVSFSGMLEEGTLVHVDREVERKDLSFYSRLKVIKRRSSSLASPSIGSDPVQSVGVPGFASVTIADPRLADDLAMCQPRLDHEPKMAFVLQLSADIRTTGSLLEQTIRGVLDKQLAIMESNRKVKKSKKQSEAGSLSSSGPQTESSQSDANSGKSTRLDTLSVQPSCGKQITTTTTITTTSSSSSSSTRMRKTVAPSASAAASTSVGGRSPPVKHLFITVNGCTIPPNMTLCEAICRYANVLTVDRSSCVHQKQGVSLAQHHASLQTEQTSTGQSVVGQSTGSVTTERAVRSGLTVSSTHPLSACPTDDEEQRVFNGDDGDDHEGEDTRVTACTGTSRPDAHLSNHGLAPDHSSSCQEMVSFLRGRRYIPDESVRASTHDLSGIWLAVEPSRRFVVSSRNEEDLLTIEVRDFRPSNSTSRKYGRAEMQLRSPKRSSLVSDAGVISARGSLQQCTAAGRPPPPTLALGSPAGMGGDSESPHIEQRPIQVVPLWGHDQQLRVGVGATEPVHETMRNSIERFQEFKNYYIREKKINGVCPSASAEDANSSSAEHQHHPDNWEGSNYVEDIYSSFSNSSLLHSCSDGQSEERERSRSRSSSAEDAENSTEAQQEAGSRRLEQAGPKVVLKVFPSGTVHSPDGQFAVLPDGSRLVSLTSLLCYLQAKRACQVLGCTHPSSEGVNGLTVAPGEGSDVETVSGSYTMARGDIMCTAASVEQSAPFTGTTTTMMDVVSNPMEWAKRLCRLLEHFDLSVFNSPVVCNAMKPKFNHFNIYRTMVDGMCDHPNTSSSGHRGMTKIEPQHGSRTPSSAEGDRLLTIQPKWMGDKFLSFGTLQPKFTKLGESVTSLLTVVKQQMEYLRGCPTQWIGSDLILDAGTYPAVRKRKLVSTTASTTTSSSHVDLEGKTTTRRRLDLESEDLEADNALIEEYEKMEALCDEMDGMHEEEIDGMDYVELEHEGEEEEGEDDEEHEEEEEEEENDGEEDESGDEEDDQGPQHEEEEEEEDDKELFKEGMDEEMDEEIDEEMDEEIDDIAGALSYVERRLEPKVTAYSKESLGRSSQTREMDPDKKKRFVKPPQSCVPMDFVNDADFPLPDVFNNDDDFAEVFQVILFLSHLVQTVIASNNCIAARQPELFLMSPNDIEPMDTQMLKDTRTKTTTTAADPKQQPLHFPTYAQLRHASASPMLTMKASRQLSDPIVIASAKLPRWISALPSIAPLLLPLDVRKTVMRSTVGGAFFGLVAFKERIREVAEAMGALPSSNSGAAGHYYRNLRFSLSSTRGGSASSRGEDGSMTEDLIMGNGKVTYDAPDDLNEGFSKADPILLSLAKDILGSHDTNKRKQLERLSDLELALSPQRAKIRLVRHQALASAFKVMDYFHGHHTTSASPVAMEIEYFEEEGVGSGPTLEFYAEVFERLRTFEELPLFRSEQPNGCLYPQAYECHPLNVTPSLLRRPTQQGLTPATASSAAPSSSAFSSYYRPPAAQQLPVTPLTTAELTSSALLSQGMPPGAAPLDPTTASTIAPTTVSATTAAHLGPRRNSTPQQDSRHTGSHHHRSHPNGMSDQPSQRKRSVEDLLFSYFKLLGQIYAKAILDGRLIDLPLHPMFWSFVVTPLSHWPMLVTEPSLASVDPTLYRHVCKLRAIKETGEQELEQLAISFVLPGSSPEIELQTGGSQILVNSDNLDSFIQSVCEWTLWKGVRLQIWAFRFGIATLMPLSSLSLFTPLELSSAVAGGVSTTEKDEFWSMYHLRKTISPDHGFTSSSLPFVYFLEVVHELTLIQRKQFLKFCTGTSVLPIGGFAGLKPPMKVVRKERPSGKPVSYGDEILPSVMACSNYIKLPSYSTKDKLKEKLLVALSEGQGAFTLS